MLAQHQQFAQVSLLPATQPGLLPPQPQLMGHLQPSYISVPAPPSYPQYQTPSSPSSNSHRRAQSSMSGAAAYHSSSQSLGPALVDSSKTSTNGGSAAASSSSGNSAALGHNRRHSLALSEAKKAAALAQAKRSTSPSHEPSSPSSPPEAADKPSSSPPPQIPSFKFPNSPEKDTSATTSAASPTKAHARSQSLQFPNRSSHYRGNSQQLPFQFPAAGATQPDGSSNDYANNDRRRHQHNRSNSRNFDSNWRQPQQQQQLQPPSSQLLQPDYLTPGSPSQFTPGHRSGRSFNNSISSIQAFSLYPPTGLQSGQQQSASQAAQQQRKSLFAPYLPQASLPGLLAEGRLVSGILRVNKKNRSDAYVSTDGLLDADIFICGSKDRNRALEGDLVAVELLEVDEVWGSKKEKEEKKKRKDAGPDEKEESAGASSATGPSGFSSKPFGNNGLKRRGSLKQRPTQKKNDDVEVEGQSLLLVEEEALSDEIKPLYAGHIVAVIDRFPGQMFSGTLGLLRPSSQATKDKQDAERKERGGDEGGSYGNNNNHHYNHNHNHRPKIVWFKPTDKRVPLIAIPTEQAPNDFVENHEKYSDKIFVASIKRWPITSLHPFGTLVEILGSGEDLQIEIEAILRDNNFTADIFPEQVMASLPSPEEQEEELITEDDVEARRDFSSEYVIAFSPLGTPNDIVEQAVHVKKISDNKVELGIHITDVTHFCLENSSLDREARKRGTAVFLKQRTVPLLPPDFLKYVSFKAGKCSVAISVVFEMDTKTCEIHDTWIGESLITPKHVLSYEAVSKILDEDSESKSTQAEVDYIKTLRFISNMFCQQRLGLDKADLPILGLLNYVDDESVVVSANIFEGSPVRQILDELSIKVNTAVAQKIFAVLGDKALLRRHSDPILQKIESFIESVKNLNLDMDTTSSASIQKSILNIEDGVVRKGLEALLYKCMTRARYFVAGKVESDNHGHYFLNLPLYTHFTSPLRRYADIVVQRQLKAVVRGEDYTADITDLVNIADSCTFKKDCAKNAQEQSIHLDVCQKIHKRAAVTGQLVIDSIIIQVYESAFDVLIPEYGIEKRVHGDQLPLRKAEFDKKTRLLELYWEGGIDSATYIPDDEKNVKSGPITRGRGRASSAASALAQEQALLKDGQIDLSKLNLKSEEELKKDNGKYADSDKILAPFFENVTTRVDNGERVQEIRVLQHVPVLLRADLGKSIPCLTVRALNPFTK